MPPRPRPRKQGKILSLDTETTGLDFNHGARPFLVTFGDEDGKNTWWEWNIDPLTRKPKAPKDDLLEIQRLISEADELVLQNAKFDWHMLRILFKDQKLDLQWDWSKMQDTLISGHLLASSQPHDLTSMSLVYLRVNIRPYEVTMKKACEDARRIAKKQFPDWRIAKQGLPDMPSARAESKGSKAKGTEGSSPWGFDMWLPRQIAEELHYPTKHPWRTVTSEYANCDSAVTLPLYLKHRELLEEKGLTNIYRAGMKLISVIAKMEARGITISESRLLQLSEQYAVSSENCKQRCIELADGEIESLPKNGMSNALRYILFDKYRLQSPKLTEKGNVSADASVLDHWIATLPEDSVPSQFVQNLRNYRRRQTARGYNESYKKFWLPLRYKGKLIKDWRILYPSANCTGTNTLRFTNSNPNGQQISKKAIAELGEKGHSARHMFGPATGREWWSSDCKNVELRIPAYEAGEQAMIDLFEKPNDPPYYGSNHLLFFDILHHDKFIEEVCPKCLGRGCKGPCGPKIRLCDIVDGVKKRYADTWYQWTKNGDFAVQYGAVAESGTADAAYHVPGAQAKIENHLTRIKALSQKMIKMAEKTGYIETMPDRTVDPTRGYPLYCTRTKHGRVKPTVPLSYHVQGTAMWVMRRMMVEVQTYLDELNRKDPRGYFIILQVHDELLFDFPYAPNKGNLPKMKRIKKIMDSVGNDLVPSIPLPVSIEYHPFSWEESEVLA